MLVKCDNWFVTTNPATEALVKVDITPEIRAEMASLETSPALEGASCPKIPIWIPKEPMFPKPQTAYVAMSLDRGLRSA